MTVEEMLRMRAEDVGWGFSYIPAYRHLVRVVQVAGATVELAEPIAVEPNHMYVFWMERGLARGREVAR